MTLRAPPKPPHATANLVGRFVGLIILLAGFAAVVWVAATNQQIPLLERSNPSLDPPGDHVKINGLLVHVRTVGQGSEVMLLLHDDSIVGGALLASTAESFADAGRRVVVPDMVGFGLSSRPSEPGRIYSSIGQAETVAAVLDELGEVSVEVVGFGWGGNVAADLTAIRPDLVSRLVMVDTGDLASGRTGWQSLEALPLGVGEAVAHTREGASGRSETLFEETCPGPGDCADPEVMAAFRRTATVPGTARSIRARRASPPASVVADRVEEIDVPVLVVSTTTGAAVEDVAEVFSEATVDVVDGPAALVEAIASG